jgi:hypothetical protein
MGILLELFFLGLGLGPVLGLMVLVLCSWGFIVGLSALWFLAFYWIAALPGSYVCGMSALCVLCVCRCQVRRSLAGYSRALLLCYRSAANSYKSVIFIA